MPARHLVLGLDGADLALVRGLGKERLPHLFAAMERGAYAAQESVQPPATLPNWTTFLTGVDPGVHGVFDFTTRDGYSVRFTAGSVREAPTLVARLDKLGKRCACLGFPATYPPDPLEHGIFVSGWDAPVAFEADRSFVHPPSLHDRLVERFGELRFDDVDEFEADRPGWHLRLPDALVARVERKVELASYLLDADDWDLFALYVGETDTASHHLVSLHDAESPRNPGTGEAADGLARVYQAVDALVGALLAKAGGESVELTIVSDHGSGGSSDKVLFLNRALASAGLLAFRPESPLPGLVRHAKNAALVLLPPWLRERIFRFGGALLPSWLESRARFGAVDFDRTVAFSEELNYFPSVSLNLRGREPRGTVAESERESVLLRVEKALLSLRDPWTGTPVVTAVHRREDLFEGPFVERAPDLVLELALDAGYSYNLLPSGSEDGDALFRRLAPAEYLGRKGRSLPGSHRPRGLFVAAGPRIARVGEIDCHIADASATLLARMDVAVPPEAKGRVLFEILSETGGEALALPEAEARGARVVGDESAVERRLRALGYVE